MFDAILSALPQTQCTRCGFSGCAPYAEAIVKGEAPIDRCPPGGEYTLKRLAELTGQPKPARVDPRLEPDYTFKVAIIDEALCIGCTKCIQACPVDAIIGAPQKMHAIIAQDCTGCALCVPPCPMDCIALEPHDSFPESTQPIDHTWPEPLGPLSRERYENKQKREAARQAQKNKTLNALNPLDLLNQIREPEQKTPALPNPNANPETDGGMPP